MTRIPLPSAVDLPAAALLAETLRTTDGAVTLDGSAVARIGVAGLQLLLAAQDAAAAAGTGFAIEHPSAAMVAAARTAGAGVLLSPVC